MDAGLVSLVTELFAAIQLLSAYPVPDAFPEIYRLPRTEIQRRLCEGRPCQILAFYDPESGVFIDESLDVGNDAFDRSILLHELVHHLQKTSGKFDSLANACRRRNAEEGEAYEIQYRYLAGLHINRQLLLRGGASRCGPAVGE